MKFYGSRLFLPGHKDETRADDTTYNTQKGIQGAGAAGYVHEHDQSGGADNRGDEYGPDVPSGVHLHAMAAKAAHVPGRRVRDGRDLYPCHQRRVS